MCVCMHVCVCVCVCVCARVRFLSLNRGELSAAELYQALIQFGQNVTDDDVTAMMDEVEEHFL